MKKILLLLIILVLPLSVVLAQNQKGIHETGNGINDPELKQQDQGNAVGEQNQVQEQNQGEDTQIQNQVKEQNQEAPGLQMKGEDNASSSLGHGTQNQRALERRSAVANAVQEMLTISERNGGIGSQIRVIAQNQNQEQEQAEGLLEEAQKRGGFMKFLIGPKYKELNNLEEKLQNHIANTEKLKSFKSQLYTLTDQNILQEQVVVMEQVRQELEEQMRNSKRGFSLFGWLNRIISK